MSTAAMVGQLDNLQRGSVSQTFELLPLLYLGSFSDLCN